MDVVLRDINSKVTPNKAIMMDVFDDNHNVISVRRCFHSRLRFMNCSTSKPTKIRKPSTAAVIVYHPQLDPADTTFECRPCRGKSKYDPVIV